MAELFEQEDDGDGGGGLLGEIEQLCGFVFIANHGNQALRAMVGNQVGRIAEPEDFWRAGAGRSDWQDFHLSNNRPVGGDTLRIKRT